MERRNRSLIALEELKYINFLDDVQRAPELQKWCENYLTEQEITDFDLELEDLKRLNELFYSNISFLKEYKENIRLELLDNKKLKKFIKNS